MGKNLGQHFLTDTQVVDDMVAASNITKDDTVLEIGPGKGVLTEKLLADAGHVIAVEKDPKLADQLQNKFESEISNNKLTVLQADVRDIELSNTKIGSSNYKIIANIPYYLTSDIIQQFLSCENQPERMVFLTQKEVAERITCADGKHSRMSIFVQAYGSPDLVRRVDRNCFSPSPKVTSAILSITDISRDFFTNISEEDFFALVKAGFQHKRKQLKNNLKGIFQDKSPKEALTRCNIKKTARAEELPLKDWRCILDSARFEKRPSE